jgi:DNA-directed RNA polymerase alpha subunit
MTTFDTSVLLEPPSMVMLQEMWNRKQVEETNLSVRTINCLFNSNISNLLQVANKSESELLKIKNFGRGSLIEIRKILFMFYEFSDEIYTYQIHNKTFIQRIEEKRNTMTPQHP